MIEFIRIKEGRGLVIDKLKSILVIVITQIIAYVFLFLIVPHFMRGNEDTIVFPTIFICTVIIYGVSFVKFPISLLWWLLGIPLMWRLIMMYCPRDLYGISEPSGWGLDLTSAGTDALIFAISLFFLQCAIKLVLFIKEVIRRKIYPM